MKFYELLTKYSNEQIIDSLHKNYSDIVDEAYLSALKELRALTPSKEAQDVEIHVAFEKDDLDDESDKLYLACDGIGPDDDGKIIRWGIEFDSWVEWLAKDIHSKCLEELDELTILAGIMWEMTFCGYSQSDLDDRRDDLMERIKEVEEHPENLVPFDFDELMKSINEDEE
jgi:hypothetical protein